ncbi:hypothetical protein [Streptomyces hydrogenans]|uniref:hypothetical protein n=1 Tax=Streptomyces hydrogenans TaxID=1873719 RepID=UPI0035E38B65
MNTTHTALLLMAIGLTAVISFLVAGAAFAVTRWNGSTMPECVTATGKAFAMALTVMSAVLTVVVTIIK